MTTLTTSTTRRVLFLALLIGAFSSFAAPSPASAQTATPSSEQQLVERFAPIFMLKTQDGACDPDGEPYAPMSVDVVLDNREVLLRQLGENNPVVQVGPGAGDLYGLNEGFFLDFPGSALQPGCLYERDFDKYTGTTTGDRRPTVYARIATQADEPGKLVVQYWFYWYYNDWNNKHESDWEGIQVLFDVGTVDEALSAEPVGVGYAQHEGGERADWGSSKLERDGDHPVVYSSAGSHASYFSSAVYIGRSASSGFGCDTTGGPSDRAESDVVLLPANVTGPDDPFAWITFNGRWGERQAGSFNAPTGPRDKPRWTDPIDWQNDLRSKSVVVPTGDGRGAAIVNTFCAIVEKGSGALITLQTSPLRLAVAAVLTLLAIRFLIKRTSWAHVAELPLVARRRSGQIIRSALGSYRHRALPMITIGLLYAPIALALSSLATVMRSFPLVGPVSILIGGFVNFFAYVVVNATVASYYDQLSVHRADGAAVTPLDAMRETRRHAGRLAIAFAISVAIVTVLFLSVIGIPFGLWFLVRFQLMPQAIVIEDLDARAGLRRSAQLVTGRWWNTAILIACFYLLIAVARLGVSLALLVGVPSLPWWVFSAVVMLVYVLVAPVAATGQALLYGDTVASERDRTETPELVDA